jgi:sporulation protein YlmC with PRC-barrel domain
MRNHLSISVLTVAALCGSLQAGDQTPADDRARDQERRESAGHHLGKLDRANKILGMQIRDAEDKKIGKVKDLAVDLRSGRVLEVIVGSGGVLGVDERFVAVPPGRFSRDGKSLRSAVDRERLKGAPAFQWANWEASVEHGKVVESYEYFGSKEDLADWRRDGRKDESVQLSETRQASRLLGAKVRNRAGEDIGKIENLLVDLPAGRVVEVIVATGGFLGLGDELSAVPPQAFSPGVERDTFALDTTKETLNQAPHFRATEWPENEEQVQTVYRAYHVDPYFMPGATNTVDNTAQNARDRAENALTPLDQGSSTEDVNVSRRIRQKIVAAEGLSVNARNIKIITRDGRVTLRGPVNSEDEKRRIGQIVDEVAPAGGVDNQLEAK